MKTYEINSYENFHRAIKKYDSKTLYRGVTRKSYELIPKIGRIKSNLPYDVLEENLMLDFKKLSYPYINKEWIVNT